MKKFIITEEEKNRIIGMHESATLKHYLNESEDSEEFVVTNDTTVDELERFLEEKIEGYYAYGYEYTLIDIVDRLIYNSLLFAGKSDDEAVSISDDFTKNRMGGESTTIPDEFDMYEKKYEGENTFDYEVIFEYTSGGDGYAFSGSFDDLTNLLDAIKELLNK